MRARVLGIGEGFLAEPWWCRTLVLSAERMARRGGIVRVAVAARQLRKPGPRQAMLDAVDLALMHGCTPAVYRWVPGPALDGRRLADEAANVAAMAMLTSSWSERVWRGWSPPASWSSAADRC